MVSLALMAELGLWPTTAHAVGSDGGSTVPTSASTSVSGPVSARVWYDPAHRGAGGGGGADPDSWDEGFTSSGTYYTEISGMGSSDPGAVGCSPGGGTDQTFVELPSMSAATDTSPERHTGLGGIVNEPVNFWVSGYGGEERRSPRDAVITITNCHVNHSTVPPTTTSTTEVHRAWISYAPTGAPVWSWGDGLPNGSGYGPVSHEWVVSSGRCNPGPRTCVDVPDRGPVYVVSFQIPLNVVFHFDSNSSGEARTEPRYRAFPVREVQSITER